MSLSPFSRDDRPSNVPPSSQLVRLEKQPNKQPSKPSSSPLTLSQALTITAGLAGLIGLLSGGAMRFSLSKSSNTRFLSPLQTFPALSNWSSSPNAVEGASTANEREGDALDSWGRAADLDWDTGSDFDEFSSEGFTELPSARDVTIQRSADRTEPLEPFSGPESDSESDLYSDFNGDSIVPSNFDAFANRKERRHRAGEDPFKSLSEGPLLRKTELSLPVDSDIPSDGESFFEENLSEERY